LAPILIITELNWLSRTYNLLCYSFVWVLYDAVPKISDIWKYGLLENSKNQNLNKCFIKEWCGITSLKNHSVYYVYRLLQVLLIESTTKSNTYPLIFGQFRLYIIWSRTLCSIRMLHFIFRTEKKLSQPKHTTFAQKVLNEEMRLLLRRSKKVHN